jgi:predicted ABC-type ATPase
VFAFLDQRPIVIALAGPNGAGKTTFYHAHLESAGLRLVSADILARELEMDPYAAANVASEVRKTLIEQRESFVSETVGNKLSLLKHAAQAGYAVVLCFIGVTGPEVSEQRVAMRVSQGGHDVPQEKLVARYPRTIANLKASIRELSHVWVFDNDDLSVPFRLTAIFEGGQIRELKQPTPAWLMPLLPPR